MGATWSRMQPIHHLMNMKLRGHAGEPGLFPGYHKDKQSDLLSKPFTDRLIHAIRKKNNTY